MQETSDEEILEELRKAIERYGRIPKQKELRYDDEFRMDVKTVSGDSEASGMQ